MDAQHESGPEMMQSNGDASIDKVAGTLLKSINDLLHTALRGASIEAVAKSCLQIAQRATNSPLGIVVETDRFHQMESIASNPTGRKHGRLLLFDASPELRNVAWQEFFECMVRQGEPLVANEAAKHSAFHETHVGHSPLIRFLGVPLVYRGITTGMIGLANKPMAYTEVDRDKIVDLSVSFNIALAHFRDKQNDRETAKQLEERAAEKTAHLEDFVHSVSHDLRTPLRAIHGFSQIIAQRHRGSLNDEGQRYVDYVLEASQQMDRLIDDLLRYSRLGRATVRREAINLTEVLAEFASELEQSLQSAAGHLEIAEDLPTVLGDPSLLRQVFTNLIDNGLKYHEPGIPPHVTIDATMRGRHAMVHVRDNGIGIEPRYREKIFAIFQRLHSDDTYPGTGIGLAIVRKAIQLMNGNIAVEPGSAGGSVFTVTLPLASSTDGGFSDGRKESIK
jgi:signal transduction histidine kinase